MKSYNHLWEQFISEENILLAIEKASKGKYDREEVIQAHENLDITVKKIKHYAENFHNCDHVPIEIYDGISRKKRIIIVPKYKEQIIHHMNINVLEPIFMRGMYEHSYGSIPNRGLHKGMKLVKKWIKRKKKHVKYCLKMDIKKFFDSIPHDILVDKFREIIHDAKFLELIIELINVTETGIPLGFYTSQWFANWYLQKLDHYIKEELCAKCYIRYMDDMVIFCSNKKELHRMRDAISSYLNKNLGLTLKKNWQVFRFDYIKNGKRHGRCLDFIGFKFYRDKIVLRKSIMLKVSRKAKKMYKKDKATIHDIRQLLSYLGWLDYTDTYNMYLKHIEPFVNIKECKKRISEHDKRCKKNERRKHYDNQL